METTIQGLAFRMRIQGLWSRAASGCKVCLGVLGFDLLAVSTEWRSGPPR